MTVNPKNIARLILITLATLIITALVSCNPHKHIARYVERHPELKRDTSFTDYDTTIFRVPAVHTDSVVHIRSFMTDTIYLKQDRLTVKTYVHNDSVYIEGECAEIIDTVFSVEEIRVPYIVNGDGGHPQWAWWVLVGLTVLSFLITLRRRR